MSFINLFDFIILMVLLFIIFSFIDSLFNKICNDITYLQINCKLIVKSFESIFIHIGYLLSHIGFILSTLIKILIKSIWYYLIAIIYMLSFTLFVNLITNLYYEQFYIDTKIFNLYIE